MTRRVRALLVFLTVMVVLLTGAVVSQLYRISNLDARIDRDRMDTFDYIAHEGALDACVSDKLDLLSAGATTTTVPGQEYPC